MTQLTIKSTKTYLTLETPDITVRIKLGNVSPEDVQKMLGVLWSVDQENPFNQVPSDV